MKYKVWAECGGWVSDETLDSLIRQGYGSGVPILTERMKRWFRFRFYCKHGNMELDDATLLEFIVAYYPEYRYLSSRLKSIRRG
jgi:hypothetical protein